MITIPCYGPLNHLNRADIKEKNSEIQQQLTTQKNKERLIKNKRLHMYYMAENNVCCVCGKEHPSPDLKKIKIKGKTKQICKECVTAIKGFA